MSKAERIVIWLTAVGVLIAALSLGLYAHHEEEHGDISMWLIGVALFFVVGWGVTGWAVYRNLSDARRAESLRDDISAVKEDHRQEIASLEDRHKRHENDAVEQLGKAMAELESLNGRIVARDADIHDLKRQLDSAVIEREKSEHDRERLKAELAKSRISVSIASPSPIQQTAPSFPSLSALHNQTPQVNFNAQEYFRMAYYSPVTQETENNIKVVAHANSPNDPETFYARFIGVGAVAYHYDISSAYIFGSQLSLLTELNRTGKPAPISTARTYYDEAKNSYPDTYINYRFEQWLQWLRDQVLIACYPSEMMEISHAGKDFLKYLAHWGRDLSTKKS